jgi:hypothetical protein
VLGDDSESLHKKIVMVYLTICKELGVVVNLFKSLLSPVGSGEFAKRFHTLRGDCSPISFGELFVSKINWSSMMNWPRKRSIRLADLSYIMGYKHRITGSINKKIDRLPPKIRNMILVLRSP